MPIQMRIVSALFVLLFLAGCGKAAPTATSTATAVLPTATAAPAMAVSTAIPSPAAGANPDGVRVTYVGNAGFLITAGDKKILIDAIFKGLPGYALPQDVQDLVFNARPPFDAVDLILVTHNHDDHFYPEQIRRYLQNNPNTVFVSTEEAARQVTGFGERVIPIQLEEGGKMQLKVNGIGIEALYISHGIPSSGPGILNLGYVVTVGGTKLLHTGDLDPVTVSTAYLQDYGLPDEHLDIAFVPHFLLINPSAHPLVLQGIQARYILPMHYAYTTPSVNYEQMAKYFPEAVVFHQEMESWVMPAGNAAPVTSTATPSPTLAAPVILQYIGNSCTLITVPDGTRIISDPYGDYAHPSGLRRLPKDLEADAVTVSHAHPDHNNVKAVGGEPQLITEPGTYQVGMVKVTGYGGYEGSPSGPSRNPHTIFVFEIGGAKIVHMGDSGPVTDPDILAAIENADIVLVNIDGYVFPLDQILPWLEQIGARTFVPTHYSLRKDARWGTPETLTLDEYLETLPPSLAVVKMDSEIQVTPGMPKQVAALTSLMLDQ